MRGFILAFGFLFLPVYPGCKGCKENSFEELKENPTYICMSFSIPDETWIALDRSRSSNEIRFVLRGLPSNSFIELNKKISSLKEKGLKASVEVNPLLFKEHSIEVVPTYIFTNGSIISGNITYEAALRISKGDSYAGL